MKKIVLILLSFVMLLSLCACGGDDTQTKDPSTAPSQITTDSTQQTTDSTEGTTEATQAPTNEPTTAPTEEPTTPPTQAPTEAPTTPPTTQPTTCNHSWKDATCSTPKTCSKCGATEGKAAGHSWKDATCSAPKTCSKCGATEGSAAGHNWGEWKDNSSYWRNPCTEDGIERRTCKNCYEQEEQVIKAAHSYEEGYCTNCDARDVSYAFVYIDFKDKLFEAYIKQALGFEPEDKVATVDMKKLTRFTIESRVTDVEELKYATNLKSITIRASNVSNLDVLSNLPITYVHLGYNGGITEIDVSFMKNLREVTEVRFYDCKLTGGSMEDVVSSPKLTYYKCLMNYIRYETDGSIDYLSGATNVTTLSLWNYFEYDTDLSVLLNLTKLKSVELYNTNYRANGYSEQQNAIIDQLITRGIVVNIK